MTGNSDATEYPRPWPQLGPAFADDKKEQNTWSQHCHLLMRSCVKTEGEPRRSAAIRTSLIVGFGNSLRGDDAIGEIVAQAFSGEAAIDGANVVICLQLTPELAEHLAVVDLVVFIDAAAGISARSYRRHPSCGGAPALSMGLVHHLNPRGIALLIQQPLRPIAGRFSRRGGRRLP